MTDTERRRQLAPHSDLTASSCRRGSCQRQQLEIFLEPEGFEVVAAANADEGLEAAARQQFDRCIIDVNMPGKNGLEMIRELRAREGYADTPRVSRASAGSSARSPPRPKSRSRRSYRRSHRFASHQPERL